MKDRRDITGDLLLCNRCGKCRSVCPLYDVLREEWGGARGKVELAEAFFRGEITGAEDLLDAFDLCLQCMTCEENCPSGMRAEEIVMAVRAEMARRGMIPWYKRLALHALNSMDSFAFKLMRAAGLKRKEPLHGYARKSPFGLIFPLFGWRRERALALPAAIPFLGSHPEYSSAEQPEFSSLESKAPETTDGREDHLIARVLSARRKNLENGTKVYYFIGHTVNHFFPEEAEKLVDLLNLLGIDVLAPHDQECCGAPQFYAGDIDSARDTANRVIEGFGRHDYDWIVTSCSSGGRMLRHEFPRLLDIGGDGFFDVEWDSEEEVFKRGRSAGDRDPDLAVKADEYRRYVDGRVVDINELLAMELGLKEEKPEFEALYDDSNDGPGENRGSSESEVKKVVTYHHPCHLNRGQGVAWQPEALLRLLPDWEYIAMPDSDRCCGGGGFFTFAHSAVSERVADRKADSIAVVEPDAVATSCPLCRIQLMDTIHRRFGEEALKKSEERKVIPVTTPVEMLADSLMTILFPEQDH